MVIKITESTLKASHERMSQIINTTAANKAKALDKQAPQPKKGA